MIFFPYYVKHPIGPLFIDCSTKKGNGHNVRLQSGLKASKAQNKRERERERDTTPLHPTSYNVAFVT